MFSTGANYSKLKTNLKLCINRLKLMEKKKTELALKARKEIAEYISSGKYERARIRVEHIIREDYLVEAMEIIEMYCDLLLARFGLIQQMKILEPGISEPVCSVIWAAPRLFTDVPELKVVADQFALKYGKPYAKACMESSVETINEKLMHRMSIHAPPKLLIEKYLIEIAKSHNVPYEPDTGVMDEEPVDVAVEVCPTLIDFNSNNHDNNNKPTGPNGGGVYPTPQPTAPAAFNYSLGVTEPFSYPLMPPPYTSFQDETFNKIPGFSPSKPPINPNYNPNLDTPPNTDSSIPCKPPRQSAPKSNSDLPELPTPPRSATPVNQQQTFPDAPKSPADDIDFEELSKRFDQLKSLK